MSNRKTPDNAYGLVQHGMQAVRDTTRTVSRGAQMATDKTVAYVREEPTKALLVAALAVAGLIAIVGLFGRSGRLR